MTRSQPRDPADDRVASLEEELAAVQAQLEESEQTIRAIRRGEVDAFVVQMNQGERVYSLRGSGYAYQAFVEHIRDGAVTLTQDDTIIFTNRRFLDMLGLLHSQVAGTNFLNHIAPEDGYLCEALLRRAHQRESFGEISVMGRDGVRAPAHLYAFPVDVEDVRTICVLVSDLTELHRYRYDLEQMVENRTRELNEQKDELRRLSAAKNELLMRLAIELEKPVHDAEDVVQGLHPPAVELREGDEVPLSRHGLALIENSLIRLNALRQDVAMLAEIESGNARLEYATVRLGEIALEAAEAARGPAREKGVEIVADLPAEDVAFLADARKMRQIISTLLLFAAESVETGPIRLEATVTPQLEARYQICATGHTLAVDDIASVLSDDVSPETVRTLSGTIPALSIWATRQMAQFMRGELRVSREESRDCLCFTVPM